MRQAEWRPRPDDPKSLAGWCWQNLVESGGLTNPRLLKFIVLPFVVCFVVGLMGGGWGWMAIAAANMLFFLQRRRLGPDPLAVLLTDPPLPGQFRAEVSYQQSGVTTGEDEIALTIIDGWLVAEGVRSSFAIRPTDVSSVEVVFTRCTALTLTSGAKLVFGFDHDHSSHWLKQWFEGPLPEGRDSVFPPARVHPREMARSASLLGISAVTLTLAAAMLAVRSLVRAGDSLPQQILWLIGIMLSISSLRSLWQLIQVDRSARGADVLQLGEAIPFESLAKRLRDERNLPPE